MSILFYLLSIAARLYVFVLLARVVIDLIQVFSRDWRPSGFLLIVCEIVYTLTDPPIKAVRRIIPPLRLGQISLDLGFIIVFFAVQFAAVIFAQLAFAFA